jgi:hypothetical protein
LGFCAPDATGAAGQCVVNPKQFELSLGWGYLPASVISLPTSFGVMAIALRLTRKAKQLKEQEQTRR